MCQRNIVWSYKFLLIDCLKLFIETPHSIQIKYIMTIPAIEFQVLALKEQYKRVKGPVLQLDSIHPSIAPWAQHP